ncbi:hypothetical protein M2418_005184 [Rhizobium sp. BIGb0125]|nr:hypothetical protein [Rhizobium sp. BIGb0125]
MTDRWPNQSRSALPIRLGWRKGILTRELLQQARFSTRRDIWHKKKRLKHAIFELHQAVESAYSCYLLTLTNYSPPSHNLKFLRGLSEYRDRQLVDIWPRDHQRFTAWYNILNEAYVEARYSKQFEISEEALAWLQERTAELHTLIETLCKEHVEQLRQTFESAK